MTGDVVARLLNRTSANPAPLPGSAIPPPLPTTIRHYQPTSAGPLPAAQAHRIGRYFEKTRKDPVGWITSATSSFTSAGEYHHVTLPQQGHADRLPGRRSRDPHRHGRRT